MAAGALPDGTPVIISGGDDGTVRVWRTADGTPVGEPLTGHDGPVRAVAAGALPDGTPVIISGGWRRHGAGVADWPTAPRSCLRWTYPNRYGLLPFTATSSSLRPGPTSPSTSQRSRGPCASCCSVSRNNDRPVKRSDNGRLSGTTRAPASDHVGGGPPPGARLGHVIRYIC